MTLASSVEFRASGADSAVITLTGLRGAQVNPGTTEMKLAGAHPFSSGCWNCFCESAVSCNSPEVLSGTDPTLTLHVAADIVAGRQYVFAFDIINPLSEQILQEDEMRIAMGWNANAALYAASMKQDLSTVPLGVFEAKSCESAALTVRSPSFKKKLISQSSPFPCATDNWICLTLVTSVPLTAEKESMIRLSAFKGATIMTGSGEISLFNASDGLNGVPTLKSAKDGGTSRGFWNQQSSAVLTLYAACRIEAGSEIRICFKVKNPVEPSSRTTVRIFLSDSNLEEDMDVRALTNLGLTFGSPDGRLSLSSSMSYSVF